MIGEKRIEKIQNRNGSEKNEFTGEEREERKCPDGGIMEGQEKGGVKESSRQLTPLNGGKNGKWKAKKKKKKEEKESSGP